MMSAEFQCIGELRSMFPSREGANDPIWSDMTFRISPTPSPPVGGFPSAFHHAQCSRFTFISWRGIRTGKPEMFVSVPESGSGGSVGPLACVHRRFRDRSRPKLELHVKFSWAVCSYTRRAERCLEYWLLTPLGRTAEFVDQLRTSLWRSMADKTPSCEVTGWRKNLSYFLATGRFGN